MPNNWKTYKLREIGEVVTGKTPSSKNPEDFGDEFAFVTPTDFGDYHKSISNAKRYLSQTGVNRLKNKLLPNNSVIVTCIGSDMGKVAINKIPCVTNQQINSIKIDKEFFDVDYIYYYLNSIYDYLKMLAGDGTTMPIINKGRFEEIEIKAPRLKEQKAIANILSAIDDKIENNLAINKTLEDMAMALYKHWFVDFGPFQDGEFVDSELGLIPKGWEVRKIGEVIETLGGGTPKTKEKSFWEDGNILWYSPTDLTRDNSMFSLDSAKKITELGLQKSSAKLFPPYSLLMSSRATIGALTINTFEASTNQGFITMIPNDKLSIHQLFCWTKSNLDLIISKANGSTFKEISKTNFRNLDIVVGKNIEEYIKSSKDIFDKVENNIKENQSLTQLRDTLLPKLISGEVRLKEFKEQIESVL